MGSRSWRMSLIGVALAVVAVVALLGARLWADDAPDEHETGMPGAAEVVVTGRDIRFDPGELRLQAGEPVRLVFVNDGSVDHDVSIIGVNQTDEVVEATQMPADNGHGGGHAGGHNGTAMSPGTVHLAASPGESISVVFTPKAGTFDVVCTVAGHREAGMVGTAVVD